MTGPNLAKANEMIKLDRATHGFITRALTGHGYFGYFRRKIGAKTDGKCKSCQELGRSEDETGLHVLLYCPRWDERRLRYFHDKNPEDLTPKEIADFLALKEIKLLEEEARRNKPAGTDGSTEEDEDEDVLSEDSDLGESEDEMSHADDSEEEEE